MNRWLVLGIASLLTVPSWADSVTTYFGGFEDSINGDYDYNDLVFSLSGEGLSLQSSGSWFPESSVTLGTSGTPFWNRSSYDGPQYNVGYCIYGGGNCNGGTPLDPGAEYLATASQGPVGDVVFTVDSGAGANGSVSLKIAGDADLLGWLPFGDTSLSDIQWLNSTAAETGTFTFTPPSGKFILVGNTDGGTGGLTFFSDTGEGGTQDPFGSHFAFFGNAGDPPDPPTVPEPGSVILMGTGLLALSVLLRRRQKQSAGQ